MHAYNPEAPTRLNLRPSLMILASATALLAVSGASQTFGSTLQLIPLLWNGQYGEYQNEGRAITPDGAFVAGVEYQSNTTYLAWMDGALYNVTDHSIHWPVSGTAASIVTGIGYRTDPISQVKQLVLDGMGSGVQVDWMTTDGGLTWGAKRASSTSFDGVNLPLANSLAAKVGQDEFYAIIGNADTRIDGTINNQRHLYTGMGYGYWYTNIAPGFSETGFFVSNPDAGNMNGVATTGRAVGWYQLNPYGAETNTYRYNCIVEYPPPGPLEWPDAYTKTWFFNGLNNMITNGEAWCVNADGTRIFGRSATLQDVNWHGYKALVGTAMNSWVRTDPLPDFPDTGGSTRLATPYGCTPDGRFAVGSNCRGYERAVLWDTGDANPSNWTVTDLTDLAASEGLLGTAPNPRWLNLVRAYSVGTNAAGNPVITGYGTYSNSAGLWNRGFVMTLTLCGSVPNVGAITTPVYDNATTVTVTGCSLTASTINVYHDTTLIGSASGGTASVVVTVTPPTLVAGWTLKATQVINGQESCLTTAPGVTVTVGANPPPIVELTTPTNNATYLAPAMIGLAATVTSNYNSINYVGFYNWGTNLIATVTTPPYAYSWANVPAGTYSLSARVGYNSGSYADSAAASMVTVSMPASTSSLAAIPLPPWTSGQLQSQGRAISPDGLFVAGASYAVNYGDGSGFLYSVANGTVIQPSASSVGSQQYFPNTLTGIGYRTDPTYGKQLVLDGMSGGYQANWSTTDGGLTWGAMRRDASFTTGLNLPTANSLGAALGSGTFYTVIGNYPQDINNQRLLYTCAGSGTWSSSTPCSFRHDLFQIENPDAGAMQGVAATGRAIGYYRDATLDAGKRHNCVVEYPPPGSVGYPASYAKTWYLRGLDNTLVGEAFCVSADGNKIFGRSPTNSTDQTAWAGYKAIVTAAMNSLQRKDRLPDFADTVGTRRCCPYGCSPDGRYVVGMNYRGREKAVLWDTGDPNPANWTVLDLTDYAAAQGILGNFTVLYRAFSVGTNAVGAPVITGVGTYDSGAGLYNRAFVMVVRPPRPIITSITNAGTGAVTVNYTNTMRNTVYTLQWTTNLNGTPTWYSTGSKAAPGTSDSQTDPAPTPATRLYRVFTP